MDPAQTPGAAGKGLTILIVDDSAMMRALIRRVAGLAGVPIQRILAGVPVQRIFEACDGRQALHVLEAHEVHALFTDLNMPVMTGMELLGEIARRGSWPHLVRVVVSTDGSVARREDVSHLQVRHYLEKPFSPEVMRDVLTGVLDCCY
jgi:two-component system chemotaxis response regulator CheY